MMFLQLTVWLYFISRTSTTEFSKINFLKSFFYEKNSMMTAHLCWSKGEYKELFQTIMSMEKPKLIRICDKRDEFFFSYISIHNYLILDATRCDHFPLILEKANQKEMFTSPFKWLMFTDEKTYPSILKKSDILTASDVVLAIIQGTSIKLLQPYKLESSSDIIYEDYGFYNNISGLTENFLHSSILQRRRDLRGTHLIVANFFSDKNTPIYIRNFSQPFVDTLPKVEFAAVENVLQYINTSYTLVFSPSRGYYKNGKMDGIVHALNTSRANISATSLILNEERLRYVDYTSKIWKAEIGFILKKPPLSYVENILQGAFDVKVWYSTFIIAILCALAFYVVLKWEGKELKGINTKKYGISDVSLISLEAVCQQGTTTEPKTMSGRIIAVTFFMAFMFIYVAYSAKIVVLLQSTATIQDLDGLLQSRLQAGALNISYMPYYLKNATERVRRELYQRKITSNGFYSMEDGMSRVRKGFFAFHTERIPAYRYIVETFTEYEICGLQELEGYDNYDVFPVVPKNSHIKDIVKAGVHRIQETGIQSRLLRKAVLAPKCTQNVASFERVGIIETGQAMMILIYGTLISVAIFVVEKVVFRYKNHRKTNK